MPYTLLTCSTLIRLTAISLLLPGGRSASQGTGPEGGIPLAACLPPASCVRFPVRTASYEGIGKPEPLRHDFHGFSSRRISEERQLIYRVIEDEVRSVSCRCYYGR
ncbi:type II toxin-antitoxin system YoeB family toxin [Streptomyces sp. NPDC047515]|uniref:type II toxin-antitoxin system YoeB family toxin n=1 Tax=Streptomyces sp. NPDC047515 TaxID=3155380 RepID=UPI0033E7BAEA